MAEAPAFVLAIAPRLQRAEDAGGGGGDAAFVDDFLKLRVDGGGGGDGCGGHKSDSGRP